MRFGSWQRLELAARVDAAPADLGVEFLGCAEVLGPPHTPRCILPAERSLRLWATASDPQGIVVVNGQQEWTVADATASRDGFVFELRDLTPPALEVRAGGPGHEPAVWRLRLQAPAATSDPASASSQPPEPRRPLPRREDDLGTAARRAFKVGHYDRAAGLLEAAAADHGNRQRLSAQIDDLTLLYYTRFERLGQVLEAKAALDRLPRPANGDSASAYLVRYYQGHWALESGELGAALRHLGGAAAHAERAGWLARRNMAEQMIARVLGRLGRGSEAQAVLARLMSEVEAIPVCERVPLLNNLAWDQLQALEARLGKKRPPITTTIDWLEQGLSWLDHCPKDLGDERGNLHLNLALAHLHAADPESAQEQLARVRSLANTPPPRFAVWQMDLEARLAMLQGRPEEALATSLALEVLADRSHGHEAGWRAALGEARALRALGEDRQAVAAYAKAEDWLDVASRGVPLDADRATYLTSKRVSTAEYLDLLLAEGESKRALAVARRARVRLYRSLALGAAPGLLDERELSSWIATTRRYRTEHAELAGRSANAELSPTDTARRLQALEALAAAAVAPLDASLATLGLNRRWQPPPVPTNETLLLYHPLPNGTQVGFAARGEMVEAHRFPAFATDHPRHDLLAPFADLLEGATQIRVLPFGASTAIDFHAMHHAGDALLATAPVVYGLDLPADRSASDRHRRNALLIAAPDGDLPAAGAELAQVRNALDDWHFVPIDLVSPHAVIEALGTSDLLHFAGHASFSGLDGLDSHLRLAGSTRLSARDLLATRVKVPELVVLAACDSAQSAQSPSAPGLGLSQAFLLGGSRVVIGATRPVDDRSTRTLFGHFYTAWDGSADDAPRALRHAQLALRRTGVDTWKSFRVLTR